MSKNFPSQMDGLSDLLQIVVLHTRGRLTIFERYIEHEAEQSLGNPQKACGVVEDTAIICKLQRITFAALGNIGDNRSSNKRCHDTEIVRQHH